MKTLTNTLQVELMHVYADLLHSKSFCANKQTSRAIVPYLSVAHMPELAVLSVASVK